MNKKLIPSLILYYNYIQPHVPIGEIRKIFHLHFFQMRFTFDQQTVSNRTFSMGQISIRYKAPKFLIYIINNPFCFFAEHVASICLGLSRTVSDVLFDSQNALVYYFKIQILIRVCFTAIYSASKTGRSYCYCKS